MKLRNIFFLFTATFLFAPNAFSHTAENEVSTYKLAQEPLIRIGLKIDVSSVSISTRDSSLVSESVGEPGKYLGTTNVTISSRSYSPPVYEIYRFEIPNIATRVEADALAQKIRQETSEMVEILYGATPDTWKIRIGSERDLRDDAEMYKNFLAQKGFENVEIVTEKYTSPSDDAIELTRQIARDGYKTEVRSLLTENNGNPVSGGANNIRTISSSRPVRKNMNAPINAGLREVIVSGRSEAARFSSLRSVTIGTPGGRGIVYLNGKRYRGKMEVFATSKNRITVVNVVPLEDYLLGVVPAELSLPQIEAQKAQAVAARTYAVANINGYAKQGFDMVDTVWSQVYKGVQIESTMGTRAVRETRGIVATYSGKPINALYTSTCGGRTENSGNIFEFDEPYLRGVHCSLEGRKHFASFLVKSSRQNADIKNEANYELARMASKYAVNNYLMITPQFTDQYFEDAPNATELKSWLNNLAVKFNKPFPQFITEDTAKPLLLAKILSDMIYEEPSQADTLLSEADINYQLSFLDGGEIPQAMRAVMAQMLKDGWFSIYPDLTLKPNKRYSRGKILRLINHIYDKKNWKLEFDSGEAKPTADGKLILKVGRSEREVSVSPSVYLFRKFGDAFYQVNEVALVGGEEVTYKTNATGEVIYLEVEPTDKTVIAENMSPLTYWKTTMSAGTVRRNLGRYVKGLGTLIDVKIKDQGFSKRATELEITTTNGVHSLKGGKIRSALRLKEQLFVMNKRYGSNGRVISYSFTGRGWGHGVGMCQYGAYGFAKMGLKFDEILKHYYTDIKLTRAY